jgi:hypothetical protein
MTVHFDVIVDGSAHGFPMGQHVAVGGQGLQGGPVQFGQQAGARAFALAEGPAVEFIEQLGDGFIHFRKRSESAMAQRGDDPTLG